LKGETGRHSDERGVNVSRLDTNFGDQKSIMSYFSRKFDKNETLRIIDFTIDIRFRGFHRRI